MIQDSGPSLPPTTAEHICCVSWSMWPQKKLLTILKCGKTRPIVILRKTRTEYCSRTRLICSTNESSPLTSCRYASHVKYYSFTSLWASYSLI